MTAYYGDSIARFRAASADEIVGALTLAATADTLPTQASAWKTEVELLREAMAGIEGFLFLEFDVPRLGSRIDAVVVSGAALIPIEFKVGATGFVREDRAQAWDYALDLKNFHRGSHLAAIFPLLVATEAPENQVSWPSVHPDLVRQPRLVNALGLRAALQDAIALADGPPLDGRVWASEPYQPTPTILQAARALYAKHSVEAISRSDAGARNLGITSRTVEEVIERARREGWKAAVFVTGVPGAGKTLVGLNVATQHRRDVRDDPTHAVFLSGNFPLVRVLQEALVRDEYSRRRQAGERVTKGEVGQKVKPFIQMVHRFRDESLASDRPPADHVVVFDEAQRAWDQPKLARFMKTKKRIPDFEHSEPEALLDHLNRHDDWAVAVCLVGGGQEIHDGEAGIGAWLDALRLKFPSWKILISSQLSDSEYSAGKAIESLAHRSDVEWRDDLHLSVSMRSFRAERVSGFVKAVLDLDRMKAGELMAALGGNYPIVLTRDLAKAKRWVREQARGTERFGLVASSQAERLKPHAIHVKAPIDPVHWFLDGPEDTRSSYFLEDAATEFQVQGLELDWAVVTWDADLRLSGNSWQHRKFHGAKWKAIRDERARQYLVNAYRVILTRARQGMAIFVPKGDPEDHTRRPDYYDSTWAYLKELGVAEI